MINKQINKVPKELHSRLTVMIIGLKSRYPNTKNDVIETLARKTLHADIGADWYIWKHKNRSLWGLL